MLFWLVVALAVSRFVRRSRFGLGLLAIRDDEGKAAMVGVHTTLYKVLAFGLSAYFVALGGGIWSYSTTHIAPIFAFDILVDVDMVLSSMLGGLGTLWGPVLGAFILAPGSDLILFQFGSSALHLAIFGAMMAVIILFLSKGILPSLGQLLQRRTALSAFAGAPTMADLEEMEVGVPGERTPP
jgi:branched-chain amino acid transport system permease protein